MSARRTGPALEATYRFLLWLVPAFGLLLAGAASFADTGSAAASRLVIDPGTFGPLPAARAQEPPEGRARGLVHSGPRIRLRRPHDDSVFRADEAVTVHVEFLPAADGTGPDMTTLKVRVRKGIFGRDITEAVEPYVKGVAIRVPAVDFSGHTGRFRFEISIKDHRDRESETEFRVTIRA